MEDNELNENAKLLNSEDKEKQNQKFSCQKVLLVAELLVILYITQLCASVPATFFSRIVLKRNQSLIESALMLQSLPLSAGIFGMIFGYKLEKLQTKRLVIGGVALTAISSIAFGFINRLGSNVTFTVVGTLLRLLAGVGTAAVEIGTFSIAITTFSTNAIFILGLMESVLGFSYMTGTFLGAIFYDIFHSMEFVFVLFGIIYMLSVVRFAICFVNEASTASVDFNMCKLLSKLRILVMLFLITSAAGFTAFLEVTLTVLLKSRMFSVLETGYVTLLISGVYVITSIIFGCLLDKWPRLKYPFIIIGILGNGTALLLTPYVTDKWMMLVIFGPYGLFTGLVLISMYADTLSSAKQYFPEVEERMLYGALAGLWTTVINFGYFLFAMAGVAMNRAINSLAFTYSGFGIYNYVVFFLISLFFIYLRCKK